jgi:hypothetical protein
VCARARPEPVPGLLLLQHFHRDLAKKDLSDDALIDLMIQYPDLIQRPIVEKRERAILSRGGVNGK